MQEPTVNAMHLAVESSPTPACLNSQAQRRLARTPGAGPHHAQLGARRRALGWRQPRRAGKDRGHPGGPPVHDGRKQAVRVSVPLISFTASHTEEFETTKNLIFDIKKQSQKRGLHTVGQRKCIFLYTRPNLVGFRVSCGQNKYESFFAIWSAALDACLQEPPFAQRARSLFPMSSKTALALRSFCFVFA